MAKVKQYSLWGLAVYLAGVLGLTLAIPPGFSSPVWPAAGIALCLVLTLGYEAAWLIVAASILFNLPSVLGSGIYSVLPTVIGIGTGSALQAMAGAWLVQQVAKWPTRLFYFKELLAVLFVAALSCVIAPTVGMTVLSMSTIIPMKAYLIGWLVWAVGDMLGVITLLPLLSLWLHPKTTKTRKYTITSVVIVLLSLAAFFYWMVLGLDMALDTRTWRPWAALAGSTGIVAAITAGLTYFTGRQARLDNPD